MYAIDFRTLTLVPIDSFTCINIYWSKNDFEIFNWSQKEIFTFSAIFRLC